MHAPSADELTIEQAFARTEQASHNCLQSLVRLQTVIKSIRHAAATGDLKALHKGLETSREAVQRAADSVNAVSESWHLTEAEEEQYISSGSFRRELLDAAAILKVGLYEQEGYLACYPSLLREIPKERAVSIDRRTYRAIRPSHLAAHLGKLQRSGPRFNAAQFLDTLHAAYELNSGSRSGPVEKLTDIYRILTILPSAKRDYSLQEFARDIYLLDASGECSTKNGNEARLHPGATGARTRNNLLVVVTREGEERTYYGIEFIERSDVHAG